MGGWLAAAGGAVALALGLWIGLGAPGWPRPPKPGRRRLERREVNPIAWTRPRRRERRGREGR